MSLHRNSLEIILRPIWGWWCHSVNFKEMTSYKVKLIPERDSDNFSFIHVWIFPLNEQWNKWLYCLNLLYWDNSTVGHIFLRSCQHFCSLGTPLLPLAAPLLHGKATEPHIICVWPGEENVCPPLGKKGWWARGKAAAVAALLTRPCPGHGSKQRTQNSAAVAEQCFSFATLVNPHPQPLA